MRFNKGHFQFAFQTVKDTPAANPSYYLRLLQGTSIGPDREIQVKRTAESGRASDGIGVVGAMGGGGQVNFVCQPDSLPALLRGALGKLTTTGTAAPYTHTITPEQTGSLPWMTAWVQIDTINMLIPNIKINTLKLLVSAADRLVVGQMDIISAAATQYLTSGPGTPATPENTANIFSWNMAKEAWKLDGTTVGYIHTFESDINNNLTPIPGEDYFPYDVQEGPLDVDYAAVITIIEAAQYNELVWGSATPSDEAEPAASIAEGSFSTKFMHTAASPGPEVSFGINVAKSQYRNALPKLQIDPDGKPQDLRLEARCVGTDPKIAYTIANSKASYA